MAMVRVQNWMVRSIFWWFFMDTSCMWLMWAVLLFSSNNMPANCFTRLSIVCCFSYILWKFLSSKILVANAFTFSCLSSIAFNGINRFQWSNWFPTQKDGRISAPAGWSRPIATKFYVHLLINSKLHLNDNDAFSALEDDTNTCFPNLPLKLAFPHTITLPKASMQLESPLFQLIG